MGVLIFCLAGCEELALVGAGAAGSQTLVSWQENLEAKKAELAGQYAELEAELAAAMDPNAVALIRQKIEALGEQQLVNEAAMLTVTTALELPKQTTSESRQDVLASSAIGALLLGWQAFSKRKLGLKYTAMKAGKAAFDAAPHPDASKALHAAIGIERTKRGL
jgi:hypothetical protein